MLINITYVMLIMQTHDKHIFLYLQKIYVYVGTASSSSKSCIMLYVVSCNFFNYSIIKEINFYKNNNNIYIYI